MTDEQKKQMADEVESYIRLCFAMLDEAFDTPQDVKNHLVWMGLSERSYFRLRSFQCGITPDQPCLKILGDASGLRLNVEADGFTYLTVET